MKEGIEILKGFEWKEELRPTDPNDIFRIEKKVVEDEQDSHRRKIKK